MHLPRFCNCTDDDGDGIHCTNTSDEIAKYPRASCTGMAAIAIAAPIAAAANTLMMMLSLLTVTTRAMTTIVADDILVAFVMPVVFTQFLFLLWLISSLHVKEVQALQHTIFWSFPLAKVLLNEEI
ncbi:hypothetical protein GQX74_006099 [Glossina fuscipes]|nr:hypothetical protein GQX74_006099 [Glossina fuscipes]